MAEEREGNGGRLSDERSEVICPAKLEISLIKVVTTPVWETMVALPDSRGFVKVSDALWKGRKVQA